MDKPTGLMGVLRSAKEYVTDALRVPEHVDPNRRNFVLGAAAVGTTMLVAAKAEAACSFICLDENGFSVSKELQSLGEDISKAFTPDDIENEPQENSKRPSRGPRMKQGAGAKRAKAVLKDIAASGTSPIDEIVLNVSIKGKPKQFRLQIVNGKIDLSQLPQAMADKKFGTIPSAKTTYIDEATFKEHIESMGGMILDFALAISSKTKQRSVTLNINSTFRTLERDFKLKGREGKANASKPTSTHCRMMALDLNSPNITQEEMFAIASKLGYACGFYGSVAAGTVKRGEGTWTHIDFGGQTHWADANLDKSLKGTKEYIRRERENDKIADAISNNPDAYLKNITVWEIGKSKAKPAEDLIAKKQQTAPQTVDKLPQPEPKKPQFAKANTTEMPRQQKAVFTPEKTPTPRIGNTGTATSSLEPLSKPIPAKPVVEVPLDVALSPTESTAMVYDQKKVAQSALQMLDDVAPKTTGKIAFGR